MMFTMLKGIKMFPTEYNCVFMIFREEYRGDIRQPALGISGVENRAFRKKMAENRGHARNWVANFCG